MVKFEEGKKYGFGICNQRTEKTVIFSWYDNRFRIKVKDDCEYVSYTINGYGKNACFADKREMK